MSAEINSDNLDTSVSDAQVDNVSSSNQGPRQATAHPSSTDCIRNILPGMHIGIADEASRVIFQTYPSLELSSVLPPHYEDIEQKWGDVIGGSKETSPTPHMPEPSQKVSICFYNTKQCNRQL